MNTPVFSDRRISPQTTTSPSRAPLDSSRYSWNGWRARLRPCSDQPARACWTGRRLIILHWKTVCRHSSHTTLPPTRPLPKTPPCSSTLDSMPTSPFSPRCPNEATISSTMNSFTRASGTACGPTRGVECPFRGEGRSGTVTSTTCPRSCKISSPKNSKP